MAYTRLERVDMMEAISEGVRRAIVGIGTSDGSFDIPHELLYEAIKQGTRDAILRVATNATDMPCADFFDSIKEGVRDAVKDMAND